MIRTPSGRPGTDLFDPRLDAVDDLLRVGTRSSHDHAADSLIGSLHERRDAERIANVHVADLIHIDGDSAGGADHNLGDVVYRFDESDASDDRPRTIGVEYIAADILIAPADRLDNVTEREVVSTEAVRIDVDLVLPDVTSNGGDFGNAGNGVELIADEPVLKAPQIAE